MAWGAIRRLRAIPGAGQPIRRRRCSNRSRARPIAVATVAASMLVIARPAIPRPALAVARRPAAVSGVALSTLVGASEPDVSLAVAVDDTGIYLAGETSSPTFPTTPGAFDTTYNGGDEGFFTKLDPTGSTLLYSSFLGGASPDAVYDLGVGTDGSLYLTGETRSADFPTTPGSFDTTWHGDTDAFITRVDPTGSTLLYSTFLGGVTGSADGVDAPDDLIFGDHGEDLAVGPAGQVFVTGFTDSPDFPTTTGAFDRTYGGRLDAFVAELNAAGSDLVFSTFLGGADRDRGEDIVLDASGAPVVAGHTFGTDFPTTTGAYDTTFAGESDAYLTKLKPSGKGLVSSTYFGGTATERGLGLALDSTGAPILVGLTSSLDFPATSNAFDTTHNGNWDGYVARFNASMSSLRYASYLGGTKNELAWKVAPDGANGAWVVGSTGSNNYPTTAGGDRTYNGGTDDGFVAHLDLSGPTLLFSSYVGGRNADVVRTVQVLQDGVMLSGFAGSSDFPTTPGAYDETHNGRFDAFAVKLT
jgi:hypothetical protein